MALDADGFYKPVVDRKKCNACGVCQRRCPVIAAEEGTLAVGHWREPKAFAAWTKDEALRLASSSGGVFSELARPILDAGGAVAGCAWGENWTPEHLLTREWGDVERMRGSKYVPSRVGDIYQEVAAALRDGEKPVLFSGTPCQVAAMEAALTSVQRQRTLLVEFICHGVPSLRVFHRYLDELFDGDSIDSYTFRDKAFGWQTVLAVSSHGKRRHLPASEDAFFQGFVRYHLYGMESCGECPFARLPRGGDVTLADYWGCPEPWNDKRGVSLALANTAAGMNALERLSDSGRIELKPVDLATVLPHNRRVSTAETYSVPAARRAFLDGMARGERFAQLRARYFPTRLQLLWHSFRQSDSKWRFLASFVQHRLRRFARRDRENHVRQ